MKSILGISAFYHDSAAAILIDGKIKCSSRRDSQENMTQVILITQLNTYSWSKIRIKSNNQIVFYEKPFLKFERLLETYLAFAPKGFTTFLMSIPIWLREKLFKKIYIWSIKKKR